MAWVIMGEVYRLQNKHDEAIKYYREAIEVNNHNFLAICKLGGALFETNKFQQAIQCYKRVIKINPNDGSAWNNLGVAL